MSAKNEPLRIFIAMPGTTMGEHAKWHDISEIKRHLFVPVQQELEERLHRPIELVIEKDKIEQGPIHQSMFSEALRARVYIADLSGANPNVYLELGARWALRDHVTVLICQDLKRDVKFNVSANRVIPYGPGPAQLDDARRQIVAAIHSGLSDGHVDSPIRESLDVVAIARADLRQLEREVENLRAERGDALVSAAESATTTDRLRLLRRALDLNPAHVRANLLLGIALRGHGEYGEAAGRLREAVRLDPALAVGWRELGVALSKDERLREAIEALQHATRLDGADSEAFANLGGAYRRLAASTAMDGQSFNWELLQEARKAYQRARELSGNDTYALLNIAWIDLILARGDAEARDQALARYGELEHLARFAVADSQRRDPWKLFDLASTLVLTGRLDESIECAKTAIELVSPSERRAVLETVVEPLRSIVQTDALSAPALLDVERLVEVYRSGERSPGDSPAA